MNLPQCARFESHSSRHLHPSASPTANYLRPHTVLHKRTRRSVVDLLVWPWANTAVEVWPIRAGGFQISRTKFFDASQRFIIQALLLSLAIALPFVSAVAQTPPSQSWSCQLATVPDNSGQPSGDKRTYLLKIVSDQAIFNIDRHGRPTLQLTFKILFRDKDGFTAIDAGGAGLDYLMMRSNTLTWISMTNGFGRFVGPCTY